mmetsp:Transcript_39730/g.68111  ORF Transcript_39730/g.68111 Transcript_39730/m.68111 type:complete len:230 (+) Transcript_39730:96-785(+)
MLLHIVRHGHRLDAEDSSWREKATIATDSPLSSFGMEQAKEVGKHLEQVDLIYCSPYLRTLQTATLISENLKSPVSIRREYGLREWVKRHKPNNMYHIHPEDACEHFPLIDQEFISSFECPTIIEDPSNLHERCNRFVEHFNQHVEELLDSDNPPESVVLVSHAATIIGVIRSLLEDPSYPIDVPTASLTTFEYDRNSKKWNLKTCTSVEHLTEGSHCSWGFPIIEKKD